ncbi:hypothetical protein MRX96_040600 [Rhipicephalus microplus]
MLGFRMRLESFQNTLGASLSRGARRGVSTRTHEAGGGEAAEERGACESCCEAHPLTSLRHPQAAVLFVLSLTRNLIPRWDDPSSDVSPFRPTLAQLSAATAFFPRHLLPSGEEKKKRERSVCEIAGTSFIPPPGDLASGNPSRGDAGEEPL